MAESFDWEEELRPVVRILVERVREEGMQLVEKAYSVISIERVRALVGIACDVGDWQVEDGYVQICERKDKSLQNGASGELQRLSEQLVRLQTS